MEGSADQSRRSTPTDTAAPIVRRPGPVRYRLDDFELSHSERALLRAMYKLTRGGVMFFASLSKAARLAGLSKRTVSRLINGYTDKRTGKRYRGLVERGVLTLMAEAGSAKKAATYRINEDALIPLARMLEPVQQDLPGIIPEPKVAPPQKPVSDETPCPATCGTPRPANLEDTVSRHLGDTVSSDLRFREEPLERKTGGDANPEKSPQSPFFETIAKTKTQNPADLAREFCLAGGIPLSPANQTTIAAAIVAEAGFAGLPLLAATRALAGHVDVARNNGQTINRFFFEDCKWRELTKADRARKASDAYMASYAAIGRNRWGEDGAAPPAPAPAAQKWDCPDCAGNSGFQLVQRDGHTVAVRCVHNGKQQ